ncbi:Tachykinin-like peptides receptor 99D [Trichoplax sp. H2]|uniref:G-protein coupled receptors family 1 profile domain-containing protein n=1 Tax=Trichoplax adhaerens TaxID=10228 RepID=B3RJP0_TRIAD|nr:hypothetical protein TRIADDRAFT_51534 [Trichoplax adhaerens]EDV28531.1 hypothetical protein TRIADDRAFT_51534 [Trichoplax adhaerens]RDD38900.1 Tachykinin-like peptides receptor 99D [Trichoplax sp. H2]|eukprot:XP_002107733.1 hypothetical protein TRIADDRAFT_51534 [Trichoplax adhaerens]
MTHQPNNTTSIPWMQFYVSHSSLVLLSVLYIITFIVAVIGNIILMGLAYQNMTGGLKTVTNIFICNLAFCDVLIACLVIPYRLSTYLFHRWPLGAFLCFILPVCEKVLFTVSIFQLLVISVIRYRAIIKPLSPILKINHSLAIVLLVWCLSLLGNIPLFIKLHTDMFYSKQFDFYGQPIILTRECRPKWNDSGLYPRFYYTTQNLMHGLPILASVIIYIAIFRDVQYLRNRHGSTANHPALRSHDLQTLRILVGILVMTIICWLPYTVITTVLMFTKLTGIQFILPLALCKWFAIFNTSHNPIICITSCQCYRLRFLYLIGRRDSYIIDQINIMNRRKSATSSI